MIRIANAPLAALFCVLSLTVAAQTPATDSPTPPLPPPHGTVLFERNSDDAVPASSQPTQAAAEPSQTAAALSDEERAAPVITAWDLDARIAPASSQLEMRARVTLRNGSALPLSHIALQISSTLTWQSATLLDAQRTRLAVVQQEAFPGVKIILVSILPSERENDKMMQANALIKGNDDGQSVYFLNLVPLMPLVTKTLPNGKLESSYKGIGPDGLHPDAGGYQTAGLEPWNR